MALFALLLAWRTLRAAGLALWLLAAAIIAAYRGELQSHFVWVYLIQQVGSVWHCSDLPSDERWRAAAFRSAPRWPCRVHGALAAEALRYTRQVTLAWTVLFAITTLTLLLLFFAGPLSVLVGVR